MNDQKICTKNFLQREKKEKKKKKKINPFITRYLFLHIIYVF